MDFRPAAPARAATTISGAASACARLLEDCEKLLADIVAHDKESQRQLILRRDETDRQLQGTHLASLARNAYGHDAPPGLSQINLVSEK